MSPTECCLLALVSLAGAAYVLAMPAPREFVLADVANRTMCPIDVTIDDNPDRIPRRIKYLRCASRPNKMCSQHATACCGHHHHGFQTECVEIHDWVQVSFKGVTELVKVPVGCTCLVQETTEAPEVS